MYFFLSDCGRVLDCAHDDECSFKLTSAEARRSADDVAAMAHARRDGKRNSKNKTRREYRRRHRYARPSVRRFGLCIISQGKTNAIFGLSVTRPAAWPALWAARLGAVGIRISSTSRLFRPSGWAMGSRSSGGVTGRGEGATTKTIHFSILSNSEFNRYDSMYWQLYK